MDVNWWWVALGVYVFGVAVGLFIYGFRTGGSILDMERYAGPTFLWPLLVLIVIPFAAGEGVAYLGGLLAKRLKVTPEETQP